MKAGEACVFDTRLLHASEENRSNVNRVAAFFCLIPKDRPIQLFFRNAETAHQVDLFQVDDEFLLHFDPLHYLETSQRERHVQQRLCLADFAALHAPDTDVQVANALVQPHLNEKAVSVSPSSLWTRLWRRFQ